MRFGLSCALAAVALALLSKPASAQGSADPLVPNYEGAAPSVNTGRGLILWADGRKYAGDIVAGKPDGYGVMTFPKGWRGKPDSSMAARVEGTWKAGAFDGDHQLEDLDDGGTYQGAVRNNSREGYGVLVTPPQTGSRYEGEWHDNRPDGHGVMTFRDGSRYDGQWANGNRNGHGVLTTPKGVRFDGEFRDGLPDGQGTLTAPNGKSFAGIWHRGCLNDGRPDGHHVSIITKPADCPKMS
jgi:hypothetical protein